MATVLVALTRDTPTGRERVAGTLKWEPSARRTVGDELVLPQGFTVALPESGDWLAVEVPPSGLGWCWRVTERIPGGGGIVRYVLVPDEPAVAYADLPDVDPATLDPAGSPDPAWWAALRARPVGLFRMPGRNAGLVSSYPVLGSVSAAAATGAWVASAGAVAASGGPVEGQVFASIDQNDVSGLCVWWVAEGQGIILG